MSVRQICSNAFAGSRCSLYATRCFLASPAYTPRPGTTWNTRDFASTGRIAWQATHPLRAKRRERDAFDDAFEDSPMSIGMEKRSTESDTMKSPPEDIDLKSASEVDAQHEGNEAAELDNFSSSSQAIAEESADPSQSNLPWYLRVSPPPPTPILSARHRIPSLPSHPPALLEPLFNHISIDLGLEDMSLLDLRTLDPPAALGSNLLMLVATARSEKHLHVSADRLCRWLRSEHGLKPFADGLLGRNELKLKLRRKAKRSRLLSAVGAKETASGSVDDGIRTGWVCVNLGAVDGGVLPVEKGGEALGAVSPQGTEGFVGFRDEIKGCRIVVQMLTEERRGALDLESLWTGVLNRTGRKVGDDADTAATQTNNETARAERLEPNLFPEAQMATA